METIRIVIDTEQAGQRLDKALAAAVPRFSRARLQALIDGGHVTPKRAASYKVKAGEVFEVVEPPPEETHLSADSGIVLDVVYEDDDLLVINKPPGLVVHPGAGNRDGTLVNALIAHCGGRLSGVGGVARPGIVHRLDKETSGLVVVAKNDAAHQGLSAQLASRTLKRVYAAFVWGIVTPEKGVIETHIGRSRANRQKMAVVNSGGKEAVTEYRRQAVFGRIASQVECRLKTGRTHQIRVHMAHLGFGLIGDPTYGRGAPLRFLKLNGVNPEIIAALAAFPRQALHAASLEFIHPVRKVKVACTAELPPDMQGLLQILKKAGMT